MWLKLASDMATDDPLKHLVDFLASINSSLTVLNRSMQGIVLITEYPEMVQQRNDFARQAGVEVTSEMVQRLDVATSHAESLAGQIVETVNVLYAYHMVAFWGMLEAAIEDLTLAIMSNEPKFFRSLSSVRSKSR